MKSFDSLLEEYCRKIPQKCRLAFASALVSGLVAHMYMFTNKLPNYDDMAIRGVGATFRLGRWFLWILGAISYHLDISYSLPWINGIVSLLLLSASAAIIVYLLNLKQNVTIVIISGLLVVFPSWTATYFFMFTAPYYALALLMSVLSVFLTVRFRKGCITGVILLACSLGIYQAYLPFAASLCVTLLIIDILNTSMDIQESLKKALKYLCTLAAGVVLYYIIMKLSLIITHQQLADYKGVSRMGLFSVESIKSVLRAIVFNCFGAIWNNNIEISYNIVLKAGYLISNLVILFCVFAKVIRFVKDKEKLRGIFLLIMLCLFYLAVNSIYIMSPEEDAVYSIMTYSYVFILILPLCLLDMIMADKYVIIEYICKISGIVMVLTYCRFANAQYLSMDLSLRQAVSYFTTMITQIKSTDGYSDELPVAFAGDNVEDRMLYENDIMDVFDMSGRDDVLAYVYSRENMLAYYCGFAPDYVTVDEINRNETDKMPCYPLEGSIKVVDGVIVIKLSEEY